MHPASHFDTLIKRKLLIRERAQRLVSDLRRMVQLIESDIESEEEQAGTFDPRRSDYPIRARLLRARRENLTATISRLEKDAGRSFARRSRA